MIATGVNYQQLQDQTQYPQGAFSPLQMRDSEQ